MSDERVDYANHIPKRAIAIVAHPDDIEFGFAGTIARWTQAGAEVCYVICTDGDAGLNDPQLTRQAAADLRRREQREAARRVGVHQVIFLGHLDGLLVNDLNLRKQLVREIRRFKPDTLVTLHPTVYFIGENYINHPDHRAVGQAALEAVFPAAAMRQVFIELEEEGLQPHRVPHVFVHTWHDANVYIDISKTLEAKACALAAHKSQVGGDLSQRVREMAHRRGRVVGMAYAESFRATTLPDRDRDYPPPQVDSDCG